MANNQTQIEITAVDKTRAAFDSVGQSVGKLNSIMGSLGAGLSIGAFAAFAKSAFDYADQLQDIAQANDVATSKVLELNRALIVSGGSSEDAGTMLSKFSQYIEKAVTGSEDAREKLKRLGVSLDDLKNKSVADLFDKTVDGLSKIESASEKTAAKLEIFGKSTKKIDISGFNEALKEAKGTQDAQAKSADEAAKIMDKWGLAIDSAKIKFVLYANELFKTIDREKDVLANPQRYDPEFVKEINKRVDALRQLKTAQFLAADAEKQSNTKKPIRELGATTADKTATNQAADYLDKLKKQVATFGESKAAALEYDATQLKLSATQKASAEVLIGQIKVQEQLAETQKKNASYVGDLSAIFQLNTAEKSNIEILQTKLDLMNALPEATRAAAEAELQLAKATEAYNNTLTAQNVGIDNAIEVFNEQYQTEKDALDSRNEEFARSAEQLKRENEDLNVSLIGSDKARAKAQNDLEYQRSIDRINSLMLEGEQAQELIDQETKNYELRQKQIAKTNNIARDLGLTFSSAFEKAVVGGEKFSKILQGITQDLIQLIIRRKVTEPLFEAFSGVLDGFGGSGNPLAALFNAKGNAFNQSGVTAFASGGVFDSPQMFNYGGGKLGVMGEAGPEAVMPLKRGANGKLGVSVDGTSSPGQINNISITVNADGSNRNEQGASELGRRIDAAVRAILIQEKRPGGLMGA